MCSVKTPFAMMVRVELEDIDVMGLGLKGQVFIASIESDPYSIILLLLLLLILLIIENQITPFFNQPERR